MGKGENIQSSALTMESVPLSEVKQHATRDDNWIIIDGSVYNVSRWRHKHPGGSQLLTHYAGQDATEAFRAFHKDEVFVNKYMKPLKVGKLQLDGATQRKLGNKLQEAVVNQTEENKDEESMKKDFENLRRTVQNMGLFVPSQLFFCVIILHILLLEAAAYWMLRYYGTGWLPWCLSAILYAASQTQAGWTQHDFGHLSVFKSRKLNHAMHLFLMNFCKGASAAWWNHMHYQHHSKPNCLNKDPDVRLDALFVFGEEMSKKVAKEKKWSMPYNYQHHYFFIIGPPLLFPIFFQLMVFRYPITRRKWLDLAVMLAFYLKVVLLYTPLLGIFGFLAYYLTFRIIDSAWFVWVSQSNHVVMEVDEDKERPWLSLQLKATCDIKKSVFNDWFTGHLNHQIEHHLFPTMPRHNLYKVVPHVKAMCKKHNIPYITKPLSTAFIDIVKSLKHSGQIWEAYYHAYHCE